MSPDDFKRLVATGMTTDQIAIVMEMMDRDARAYAEAEEARKAKGRDRVAKWRLEHGRNVTVTEQNVTVRLAGEGARVEDKTLTSEIEPQESKKEQNAPKRDAEDFRQVFRDLDADHLDALIKHRRFKRAPLTKRAAELFRRDVEACGITVADAVDTVISRNWITVRAEWLTDRRQQGPPIKTNPVRDVIANLSKEMEAANAGSAAQDEGYRPALVGISYRQHG